MLPTDSTPCSSFVHSYVWLQTVLGIHGVFWSLAAMNIVQIVFAQFWLPETRGLSLEEIQRRWVRAQIRSKDMSVVQVQIRFWFAINEFSNKIECVVPYRSQ